MFNWVEDHGQDSVWPNGWVFIYELNGCGFESSCSHLNFRFRASFEQGVPWHSGNYGMWMHSETRPWHDKNIQLPFCRGNYYLLISLQHSCKATILKGMLFIQPPSEIMEEGKICKLQRYIYGLNNAPREWYNRVEQELLKFREGGGGRKNL